MKIFFHFSVIGLIFLAMTGVGCSFGGSSKGDASKDGGVYKSTDSGAVWSQVVAYPTASGVGNIGTAEILSIAIDPQDHEVVYAGTSENGLLMSYDAGISWQSPKDSNLQSGKIVSVAVDPKNICAVYAASETGLYKTETCGREFFSVYDEARDKTYLKHLVLDWYNDNLVYLGLSNGDVLKSVDGGTSWTKINSFKDRITTMAISNQDSRVILVGTNSGLWKSIDSGATWTDKTEALENYKSASDIYSIVQDSTGSTWLLSSKYGILRSVDAGETWAGLKLLTSAGQVIIDGLALDPKDVNKIYYASASAFYSTVDSGTNWDTLKLAEDGWAVSVLLVDPEETGTLYLGKEKSKD